MAKTAERDAYQRAWAAMQKLLREGRSFSSRERNCAFLNLHGSGGAEEAGKFATVSAATGLDFPDDGRGLALCDWDHDGREDLWTINRTGPRVRLLLNRYGTGGNGWVSLRLTGDGKSVNRDAVGARIEVTVAGSAKPLLRTVYGGGGFLSQSSVWQHFGLGAGAIEKITVRWPGGPVETFTGAEARGFFDLKQGAGAAVRWTPPDKAPALATGIVPDDNAAAGAARVVLVAPLPLPPEFLPAKPGRKGLLVQLWSTTCPNCAAQMKAWSKQEAAWLKAGVPVFAWCLDAPVAEAEKKARALGTKMAVGSAADSPLPAVWNAIQKGLMGYQQDLPVPASFLVDAAGRLVAFYKGPADAKQITSDFSLLAATKPNDRLNAAAPERGGKWFDAIAGTGVRGPAVILIDEGLLPETEKLLGAAIAYYKEQKSADPSAEGWRTKELADSHRLLGTFASDRKDWAGAEENYLASIALNPGSGMVRRELIRTYQAQRDRALYPKIVEQLQALLLRDRDPEVLGKLGVLYLEAGQAAEAQPLLTESAALRADALILLQLGQAHRTQGHGEQAAAAWTHALAVNGELMPALNNLAWLRATHPDAALRDGKAAIALAERAVAVTQGKHPIVLGTLAAAQAEAGDFSAAAATAEKARVIAVTARDPVWPQRLADWKARFTRQEPLRE